MRTILLSLLALTACQTDEGPVGVNEVGPTWIEFYNADPVEADLAGWTVEVDEDVFLLDGRVGPDETLVVPTDGFRVAPDGAMLVVRDAAGTVVQRISVPELDDGSYGRVPDGIANWQLLAVPSPGEHNALP